MLRGKETVVDSDTFDSIIRGEDAAPIVAMDKQQNNIQVEPQKQVWMQQQEEIAAAVIVHEDIMLPGNDPFPSIDLPKNESLLIGGTDVSFPKTPEAQAVAVYTILRGNHVVYCQHVFFHLELPYIPGFLAFREIEPLVQLVTEQQRVCPELTPSVILVDGNGIWHERSAGLATALGVRLHIPTIGVGKTFYNVGDWHKGLLEAVVFNSLQLALKSSTAVDRTAESILWRRDALDESDAKHLTTAVPETADKHEWMRGLSNARGIAIPLITNKIGLKESARCCILMGHGGCNGARHEVPSTKPIFVSVGHNVSLRQAVLTVCSNCLVRIPEAIRQADLRGREMMRQAK